ncbi:MAG: rhombosortase [Candidatus Thiodiazotropha sp.]|jgi:rhomboid family GlyGly-CTERM serine protease
MKLTSVRPLFCPLVVSLLCILLYLLPESWQSAMQYQRSAIRNGEIWRLITAHFTHLNGAHLLMNLIGLWLIWLLFFMQASTRSLCLFRLPIILLGTTLALFLFSPDLVWYRGLSGGLHGMLALALLLQWRQHPYSNTLLLILFTGKIVWEQVAGPVPGSEAWVAGRVIVDSHLYGAICGSLIWLFERRKSLFQHREVSG